jgi:3'(2'), 5'-bisphosphate nucleotidase
VAEVSGVLAQVIEIARRAGEAILKVYETDFEVEHKADDSPLTEADLAAHRIILSGIQKLDPDTPFISEEADVPDYEARKGWTSFWIWDPLDGTKEFVKRNGEFTVNIAKIEDGKPVLGVVYVPVKRMLYYGSKENGSWKQSGDEAPTRLISKPADKTQPLVVVSSRSHGSGKLADYLSQFDVKDHIFAGSSLKFCQVAEGKADIYPRLAPTMEWDVAAGDCVYRYSAEQGEHKSEIIYNKSNLLNGDFVIGF